MPVEVGSTMQGVLGGRRSDAPGGGEEVSSLANRRARVSTLEPFFDLVFVFTVT
jgi:hypothetical protein